MIVKKYHLASNGCVNISSSFHRFNSSDGLSSFENVALLRQLNEHNVTQLLLRMNRDTDGRNVPVQLCPLMRLSKSVAIDCS